MANASVEEPGYQNNVSRHKYIPELPSEDWELNILIDDIANQITDDEVKRLKQYLIGGTGRKTLSEITDGVDFFTHLRTTGLLSRDNILVLQAMLFHLRRIDLLKKTIEYTKQIKNVLHFYAPSDKPENGYKFLKVHVVGTENFDRDELEILRGKVARLLVCPPEFVIVNGLQATNSILVTFMVPEEYIDFLFNLEDYQVASLTSGGIDKMEVDGKFFDLKDMKVSPTEQTSVEMNKEMQSLQTHITRLESQVDELNAQLIKTERDKEKYRKDLLAKEHLIASNEYIWFIIAALYFWTLHNKIKRPVDRLSTHAAKATFEKLLKDIKKRGYEVELIQNLIESNGQIITSRLTEEFRIRDKVKDAQIKEMISRLEFLQYERDKLAFYLRLGEKSPILSEREEFWLRNIANRPVVQHVQVMQNITTANFSQEDLFLIFSTLSDELSKKERLTLIQNLDDNSKRLVEQLPNKCLEMLWEDDLKKGKGQINSAKWVQTIMNRVHRADLITKFHEMAQIVIKGNNVQEKNPARKSMSSPVRKSPGRKQRMRRNTVPDSKSKNDSESGYSSSGFARNEKEPDTSLTEFQILNARMQKMESALEALVTNTQHPFSSFSKGTDAFSTIPSYISK